MSPSPENTARSGRYENGWIAINRLIRQGETWSGHERNVLYWNHGDGTFSDLSAVAGLDFPEDSRAFAAFDFDQDGDLDMALKNRNSPQLRLLRNDMPAYHHSVGFHLQGNKGNRDAVGARLVLETTGRRLTRTVRSGSGFLSQATRTVYFGLGEETKILTLTVFWPGGKAEKYHRLPADHLVRLTEGQADFSSVAFQRRSQPVSVESLLGMLGGPRPLTGMWLTEPVPAPQFEVRSVDGATHSLENYRGRFVLLNFWATWCSPCQAELADLQNHKKEIEARGLLPLLVSVDEPGSEEKVRQYARGKGLNWPILLANEELVRCYGLLLRHLLDHTSDLVIPTSFLVNPTGEIVRVYAGRASAKQIVQDLTDYPADPRQLVRLALPFPGRAYVTDFRRNWATLASSFANEGFSKQALAYLQHAVKAPHPSPEAFDYLGLLYAHQGRWQEALEAHQRAMELGQSGSGVQTHLATALAQLGRLAEAEAAAQRAIGVAPRDAEALRVWAAITSRRGKPEQALPALQLSLQHDPESADGHYNLGLLHQKLGRSAEAAAAFRHVIVLAPTHADALNALGVVAAEGGSHVEAIDYFGRAIQAQPGFAAAHRNLGLVYAQQGNWRKAEESFRAALKLHARYAEALSDLGGVYLKTGLLREALSLFQQAQQEKPDLIEAYLNQARVYMELGENQNAVAILESLLKVQPGHPTAVEWLQRFQRRPK